MADFGAGIGGFSTAADEVGIQVVVQSGINGEPSELHPHSQTTTLVGRASTPNCYRHAQPRYEPGKLGFPVPTFFRRQVTYWVRMTFAAAAAVAVAAAAAAAP